MMLFAFGHITTDTGDEISICNRLECTRCVLNVNRGKPIQLTAKWSFTGQRTSQASLRCSPWVSILSNGERPSHKSHKNEKKVSRGCCNTKNWNWMRYRGGKGGHSWRTRELGTWYRKARHVLATGPHESVFKQI